MNVLSVFSVQVFDQDNLVDYAGGIVAWTRWEAYALVKDGLEKHKSFSIHRIRVANEEEVERYMQNQSKEQNVN